MGNNGPVESTRTVFFGWQSNANKYVDNSISTTKYSYLSFIPHAVFLQFLYPRNFIFLANAILQSIRAISNLSPWTAILPLIVVILVSVIRQGWQDWKRRRRDHEVNTHLAYVLQNGSFKQRTWQQIRVGDYVAVLKGKQIPADLILLQTSEVNGIAYVQTSNLDGERNLKAKQSLFQSAKLYPTQLQSINGTVQIDSPNPKLNIFDGTASINQNTSIPLTQQNLLLRGTSLQNIDQAIGLVVYTGMDTKIMRNLGEVRNKINKFEVMINWIQLILAILLFFMVLTCGLLYRRYWIDYDGMRGVFYLYKVHAYGVHGQAALVSLSSFVLLNTIIPLSLNISLQLIAAFQSDVFEYDIRMSKWIQDKRVYCTVNNSRTISDLGIVQYILTDKTGTLTSNQLQLKGVSIGNKTYSLAQLSSQGQGNQFNRFWLLVLVCNDLIVDSQKGTLQGSSADQVCFVEFAQTIGYKFIKRQNNKIYLQTKGQQQIIEIVHIIPFDERKMMSVIFRDPTNRSLILATKGADSSILIRSNNQSQNIKNQIDSFSKTGYRTLVFAEKRIDQVQVSQMITQISRLKQRRLTRQIDRQQYASLYSKTINQVQQGISIVGVTAIEDKLQDGVPETIRNFRKAGLQVAMITGDKLQTAQNIGYLSNFIDKKAQVIKIRSDYQPNQIMKIQNNIKSLRSSNYSVMVEGEAIASLINNPNRNIQQSFANVIRNCSSVIFCRSTPSQKGFVVLFYKRFFRDIVVAIGDGGNDVRMIQEADIGVGLLGKQGNQASSSADFSISQFRFLQRLILHHGRWTLFRMAFFFNYYGFKVTIITIVLFCYLGYCGYSGTSLYPNAYLAAYNSVLTVVLPILYAVYQQDINVDMYSPVSNYLPVMYRDYKKLQLFSYWRFFLWTILAIIYGVFIFFTSLYVLDSTTGTDNNGRIPDQFSLAVNLQFSLYFFVTAVILIQIRSINLWIWFAILFLTIIISLIFFIIQMYAHVDDAYYAVVDNFNLRFWLLVLVNSALGTLIRYIMVTLDFTFWPNSTQVSMLQRNYLPPKTVEKYSYQYMSLPTQKSLQNI